MALQKIVWRRITCLVAKEEAGNQNREENNVSPGCLRDDPHDSKWRLDEFEHDRGPKSKRDYFYNGPSKKQRVLSNAFEMLSGLDWFMINNGYKITWIDQFPG